MSINMQFVNETDITYHVWKEISNSGNFNIMKIDNPCPVVKWPWNNEPTSYAVSSIKFSVVAHPNLTESVFDENREVNRDKMLELVVSNVASALVEEATTRGNICIVLKEVEIISETVGMNGSIEYALSVRYVRDIKGTE